MKFLKVLFAQLLFILFFCLAANAQNDPSVLNKIMVKTAKYYNDHPIEKVYLHFDKPYYAVGDTIWFKAYLTIDKHLPSPLSKIIYVVMLGPRDTLTASLKLQVKNGEAWGSIPISPYTYKKGNYRILGYTNWMNNNGIDYFFNKSITIGDAINSDVSARISLKTSTVNKIAKIAANIAYKDIDGNPYSEKRVSWSILNDDEPIAKGKGTTDKNGLIDISFINLKNLSLDSANLVTVLDDGKKQTSNSFPLKSIAAPVDIQFFPEGGGLITGLPSKVFFKAVKSDGLGIDLKGTLTDNSNNVVAEFTSSHLGMGVFSFTPLDGKTYTLNVTYADGSTAKPDLPKIQVGGINLSIDNSDPDVLKLKLLADEPFVKEYQGKLFYLLAKSSGVIGFAAQTTMQGQSYNASIPKSKFPTGILQVTLFSPEGDPLSERIAFIQHNDQLNLAINSDHPTYTTRQKVKLNLTAKNSSLPVEGNFSISVIDDSKVPVDESSETTILTYLLLTSDIQGYIEKPNYYFNHPDEKTAADLDILLQTQGYRRFSYDDILDDKNPPMSHALEQGIDISGTLRTSAGIPVKGGNIRLLIRDKNYSANAVSDPDGRFKFANLVFPDSAKVNITARNNPRADDLVITLDSEPNQGIPPNFGRPDQLLNIDSVLNPYLKNSKVQYSNSHVLKEVVIKDKRIVKTVSHKDYSNLASLSIEPDHLVKGEQLNGCNSVLECLKTLAVGMIYDDTDHKFYVSRDYYNGKRVPVQVFIKGLPVEAYDLASLNPGEIESVEVFLKDELGLVNSANNSNGAMVVNMRKIESTKISLSDLRSMLPQRNDITVTPKGYEPIKTFYLPRYDGPRETQTNQVDTRSTIYWNPNVTTDKTGVATIEYFNADGRGTYRAIVEGIDKDGNIGRQLYRYTVK